MPNRQNPIPKIFVYISSNYITLIHSVSLVLHTANVSVISQERLRTSFSYQHMFLIFYGSTPKKVKTLL